MNIETRPHSDIREARRGGLEVYRNGQYIGEVILTEQGVEAFYVFVSLELFETVDAAIQYLENVN